MRPLCGDSRVALIADNIVVKYTVVVEAMEIHGRWMAVIEGILLKKQNDETTQQAAGKVAAAITHRGRRKGNRSWPRGSRVRGPYSEELVNNSLLKPCLMETKEKIMYVVYAMLFIRK